MKKALVLLILSITLLLCLTACHSHNYGEWLTTKVPSCNQDGEQERYCSCGDIQSRTIMSTSHKWVEATCEAPKTCSDCGKTEGAPTEHDFSNWQVTEPVSCIYEKMQRYCFNCNFEEYVVIESFGHRIGAEATCTTAQICTVCKTTITPALGHIWKDATCVEPITCQRAGCGATEGKAKGHSFGEWVTVKDTTETNEWLKERTCDCGEKETKPIPVNYIYFGEYPQTIKAESVTITSTTDDRGYYLGSDGYYYAKVVADPFLLDYTFSSGETITYGTVYYFKVEPIRWIILSEENGEALILCDSIIEKMVYQSNYYSEGGLYYTKANGAPEGTYANNYEYSEIRAWLNHTFLETAFSASEQEKILTTLVDNSEISTGYTNNPYVCNDTNDKIFILSTVEERINDYGFSNNSSYYSKSMVLSDYARALGLSMDTSSDSYGIGDWWLRSPSYSNSGWVRTAYIGDQLYGQYIVDYDDIGVVPALKITLEN